jgi:hypothetical protein
MLTPMHRHRAFLPRTMAALAASVLLMTSFAAVAHAQNLTERLTDEAGALDGGQRSAALDAIDQLESSANIQLWALFVDTTGGEAIDDYTQRVVDENGLGVNDALFVVAVDDRRYQLWISDSLTDEITTDEQDAILADRVEPALRDADWGGSVVAAAEGLADAATTGGNGGTGNGGNGGNGNGGNGGNGNEQPAGEPSSGPSFFVVLLAVVLIGVGGWLLWSRLRAGRAREEDDRERERRLRGLSQQANALLIETDERLRHDAQELGFVEAEFGSDAADPFREALAKARAELQAAFKLRQLLDDNQPETPPEREKLLNEIVSRCEVAKQLVEEQTQRFRELRDLERRAPEILAEQERRIGAVESRIPGVESSLAELRTDASGSSQAVQGNVSEARKRIELARRGVTEGQAALHRSEGPTAARAAKASQDALAQAAALLDAVDREAATLTEARTALDPALAQARADLEAATKAVAGAADRDQADELATAQAKLQAAEAAVAGTPRDLVLAYRLAREAESEAEQVVARVHEGEQKRAKERAAVDAGIRAAELSLDRASEFIAARRHGVGRRPRTALSEADVALDEARRLRDTDPAAAIASAKRATQLADEAYQRAQDDFASVDRRGYGGTVIIDGQPYSSGRSNWGSDVGGAIIGGIIGSILSGGGRGGGWGGGGFGGFGGGGGIGRGLGGGGRSFGGGFGGGGGRSRGGGW